jgi:hypothetical protein
MTFVGMKSSISNPRFGPMKTSSAKVLTGSHSPRASVVHASLIRDAAAFQLAQLVKRNSNNVVYLPEKPRNHATPAGAVEIH